MPALDFADLVEGHGATTSSSSTTRSQQQSAPEMAQSMYNNALENECAIGDYINVPNSNSVMVSEEVRTYMITIIMELHRIKSYKEETLYLAASLADRYLALLTILEK